MPNEPEVDVSNNGELVIFEFDFEGKTNAKKATNSEGRLDARKAEQAVAEFLNARADELATELQVEVQRVFQPFTTGSVVAEVEVEFRYESDRSIILAGVITALGVIGPFAAQVAAGALATPLSKLLERGVKRLVRRWQREKEPELSDTLGSYHATLEPFTMNLFTRQFIQPLPQPTPTEPPPQPIPVDTRASLTGQSSTPWLQVQQQTNPPPPVREMDGAIGTSTHWLFPAIAIGTAVIIVLLAVILTIVIMQTP